MGTIKTEVRKYYERERSPPRYLKILEPQWRAKLDSGRRLTAKLLPRDPNLNPSPFIGELLRLATLTGDPVFKEALLAMHRYGFIDLEKERFLSPRTSQDAEVEKALMLGIADLIGQGSSVRHASAAMAAKSGYPAASLEAAAKQLEKLYKSQIAKKQRSR